MVSWWYLVYILEVVCPLLLVGWLVWLVRHSSQWASRLAIDMARVFAVMALLSLLLEVISDPRIWRPLLAANMSDPHVMPFWHSWLWEGTACWFVSTFALYCVARWSEKRQDHHTLLRAVVATPIFCWSAFVITFPVLVSLGGWTWGEYLVLVGGGLVIVCMFSLTMYVRLEPRIAARFGCLTEEVSLSRKLGASLWTVFFCIIVCMGVVAFGNRAEPFSTIACALGACFLLFSVPYAHLVHMVTRSLVLPLADMASQIAEADGPSFIRVVSRDEVAVVANSYNDLIKRLQRSYAALEGEVAARTAELAEANESLRDEIAERVRIEEQLRIAKEGAEAATQTKSDFLANMSHEIRTPMTAILGFTDCLLDRGLSDSEKLNAIHTIRRNGEHLTQIINDILDVSKIEAGKLDVEQLRFSPVELVAEVQSLMQVRATAKHLAFDTEYVGAIPETIESDPTRLRQILVNLVGNAIKFTEEGGVRLVTRFVDHAQSGPVMCFDVIDTGIGMDADQMGRLFQPFTQVDSSTTRKFGGTGLGLTISKRLAQMLGGDITVESNPSKGTTFQVSVAAGSMEGIKMLDSPEQAAVISSRQIEDSAHQIDFRGYRILLAEDGVDNQRLIAHILNKAGAEVTVVENGRLAVDAALAARDEGNAFHVILMDIQMPVMDGYEAASLLRQKGYIAPIIALTAHAMASDREKCLKAGCDDYATKPIDRDRLLETIIGQVMGTAGQATQPREGSNDLVSELANDADMAELVTAFVEDLPDRIAAIENALAGRDLDTLTKLAHQLKGSGSGYGFPAITEAAAELEATAKAATDLDRLAEDVRNLADLCNRAAARPQQQPAT